MEALEDFIIEYCWAYKYIACMVLAWGVGTLLTMKTAEVKTDESTSDGQKKS